MFRFGTGGMYFHSRNYSMTVAGAIEKSVVCEHCGAQWTYGMVRQSQASAMSAYGLGEKAAQDRARYKARRSLQELLKFDCEIIPCPTCARLQPDMRRKFRVLQFRKLCMVTAIALMVIAFAYPILGKNWIPAHPAAWTGFWYALGAAFLLTTTWVFVRDLSGPMPGSESTSPNQ